MRTLTRLSRAAALPLAATLLVACGGGSDSGGSEESGGDSSASSEESGSADSADETEAYCEDLSDAQESFQAFDSASPEPEQLQEAFETFRELAQAAPPEVESDWQTIDTAVETVQTSLAEIDLEISDLAGLQQGQVPEGVTPQQLQQVAQELQSLAGPEFAQAGEAIEQHAQEECDIDLSPSNAPSDGASPSQSPTG